MRVCHIVGARPNFMKVAPVLEALRAYPQVTQTLVHTGQHYDVRMSDIFFQQLGIPQPDYNLEVGSGTHSVQTAETMIRFEPVALQERPDWIVVYGDVNSTVAAALVAAKLLIPLAHVEAGLRSFDRTMPEEINRLVTDRLSDLLFTPSADGDDNLRAEGTASEKIHRVGNVMIDTLIRMLPHIDALPLPSLPDRYALVTLHRPSNVDEESVLRRIMEALHTLSRSIPILFPIHPRTRRRLETWGMTVTNDRLQLMEPMGYLEFIAMQKRATFVITDSGGVQEETTFLRVPCFTLRENTERPVTITEGSNLLIGQDMERLLDEVQRVLSGAPVKGSIPPLWDGKASERIAAIMANA